MNVDWTDRLSEYLDGELSRDEARALEARLAEDAELDATLEELRTVKRAAAAQPDFRAPAELWEEVRARLDTRSGRRKLLFTLPQLAAAAGIVLLLGVSVGRMTDGTDGLVDRPAVTTSSRTADDPATIGTGTNATNAEGYAMFVRDLETRLDAGRDELEPQTARVLEESLATIDSAIARARTALEDDPNNAYLNQHLASARARKLRLLENATTLIASQT